MSIKVVKLQTKYIHVHVQITCSISIINSMGIGKSAIWVTTLRVPGSKAIVTARGKAECYY